jgi:two-component system cell cycle sensor histidine kinase/response regulator CckA
LHEGDNSVDTTDRQDEEHQEMTDEIERKDQVPGEIERLRRRVAELEAWKARHEWVLETRNQCETQFGNLADNSVVGIYVIQDGIFKYVNAKLAEIFGYSVEDLLDGTDVNALIFPEDRPMVKRNLSRRISGEIPSLSYRFRGVRKTGELIHVEVYGSGMLHDGSPAVMGILIDVTERFKTEALLEKELKKFRVLYDLATAMTAERDLDENLLMVVEKSRDLLGVDSSYIALRDENAEDVYMHVLSGIRTEAFKRMRLPFGLGIGGKVATTGKGFIVRDYSQEIESPVHEIVRDEGLISGIAVPIRIGQRNLGVLYGFNRTETEFSKSDLDTLFLLGNLAAVEIIRKRQEIAVKKAHDELEQKVQERTLELYEANMLLRGEIAERERAQDALRQNESMLRNILSTSPVAIGLTENRVVKWANEAWMNMFGFQTEEDFAGVTAAIVYPSDEEFERVGAVLYDSLKTGSVTSTDATFRRQDGSLFEGHIRMKALMPPDLSKGVISAISDISVRKRMERAIQASEARYRALAENSLTGICLHRGGRFIYVNECYARNLGYTPDELIGRPVIDIVAPQDRDKVESTWLEWCSGKDKPCRYQARALTKDGKLKWFDVWATVLEDEEGQAILFNVVDITERKLDRKALRDSRERLELVLEGADLGLWDWNCVTGEVFYNQRWADMIGVPLSDRAQAIDAWKKIVHPEDVAAVANAFKSHFAGTTPFYESEYRLRNSAGAWNWILARGKIVERDEEGKPVRMTGTCLDITDRKLSEAALQQSENKFRLLYEHAPVGYQSLDEQGRLIEVNRAWLNLLGYSREEVIGTWFADYLAPGFREAFQSLFLRFKSQGETRGAEFDIVKKDGTAVTVSVDGSFVMDDSGTKRSHCILYDISQRRKAEKVQRRLATAIEQTTEGIIITDTEGRIQYANPAFESMTGYSREEVLGRMIGEMWETDSNGGFVDELTATLEGSEVWRGRLTKKRKDGATYQEDTTISPVFDHSGQVMNYVAVMRDVTDHVALEKQLQHSQKMEAIGTLAGGIAHDFNNLLTIVSGYTELLMADSSKEDPTYADLSKIAFAAQRGSELVRSLLAFSRKVETKPRPVNINHSIEQVRKLLFRTIPKMIEIKVDLAHEIGVVNADPAQMEQILINLAVNAKDAMPEGGTLAIQTANVILDEDYCRAHFQATPGPYVQITVSDTGEGMEQEVLDHIFEPFYTTKRPGQGTGLGLAMVYGIVQQHGGHITCTSAPGTGTAFRVYIPAIETEPTLDVGDSAQMMAFGTETLLLVDDEEFVRDLGVRILSHAGYTVLTAANGKEALDVYLRNKDKIELVILDLIMPEMGGVQCLQELLNSNPLAKVIVASGFSVEGPAKEALESGALAFVNKPYKVQQILKAVRQVLDKES